MALLAENKDEIKHHNMMEFFEMCAGLIGSLARWIFQLSESV
jgi:hypothetical protein